MTQEPITGTCRECGRDVSLTADGRVRVHGPLNDRCEGSGKLPDTGDDDPGAPVVPLGTSPAADAARMRIAAGPSAGPNPHRPPLPTDGPGAALSRRGVTPLHTPAQDGSQGEDPFASPAAVVPGKGLWFPSRYDGDCDTCGSDFGEGDDIRADGCGGWEGRDCADLHGDDADDGDAPQRPAPGRDAVPRRVTLKVPLNGNHRYVMPHPVTGRQWTAQRVTTFTKLASEVFALTRWELRCAVVGMAANPALVERVRVLLEAAPDGDGPAELVGKQRPALELIASDAKAAAGDKDKARKGTRSHKFAEELDAGHRGIDQVPGEFRADLAAYLESCRAGGYTMLPHLIERTTGSVEFGIMGTFDRVARCPDGLYRAFDQKSGKIKYGQKEIAAQLASYVTGCNETGIAEYSGEGDPKDWESWRWVPLTDEDGKPVTVETDYGIVAHVPYGQGECTLYPVPLDVGREAMRRCAANREWQRSDACFGSPIPVPALDDVPDPGEPEPLTAVAADPDTWTLYMEPVPYRGRQPDPDCPRCGGNGIDPEHSSPGSLMNMDPPELVPCTDCLDVDPNQPEPSTAVTTDPGPAVGRPAEADWDGAEWTRRFSTVATADDAKRLYRAYVSEHGTAPAPTSELPRLVEAARASIAVRKARSGPPVPFVPAEPVEPPWRDAPAAPAPTWEQRFAAVATKAQASALYREYREAQGSTGPELDRLVAVATAKLSGRA